MVGQMRNGLLIGVALACVALAGCKKTPEGQVVATVNGDEITRRDLATEFSAMGGTSATDLKAAQPALVQSVVDRELLVQEAKRTNLDKNPQYLALRQRADDFLLAQMLAQSWAGKLQQPSAAETQAFIAANPLMFGQRKAILVNAILIPAQGVSEAQLRSLGSNDAIAAWLSQQKKPFQRADRPLDTMRTPKQMSERILAQNGGPPLIIRNGPTFEVVSVKAIRELPVPPSEAPKVAREALVMQQRVKTTDEQLKRLRQSADIKYSPEFAPPKNSSPKG